MTNTWGAFEHLVWKNFKATGLEDNDDFTLALSGGLDSMVLLALFVTIKPFARLHVCHFHHGPTLDPEQKAYRDKAQNFLQEKIKTLGRDNISFTTADSAQVLESEEEYRAARWAFLRSVRAADSTLVTAHHLDDHLETMLLKLIRGTGLDGLKAFKVWNKDIFRPFLQISKAELLAYAETNKLDWIEDPSNRDPHFLRNWLREDWLKALEKKLPGARANLAKSLLKIANASTEDQPFELNFTEGAPGALNRQWYISLGKEEQLRALALFLKSQSVFSFTSGQLEEIRKRLDKNQKDITFDLVGKKWVINALQIMLG